VLSRSVQNLLNVLQVFHPILVEDEDVIQIHHRKISGERKQDIIHHTHENCWGIFQAKGHDQSFKNTLFGIKGSLSYIGLLYCDMVVDELQINIIEVFFPLELVKEIVNLGNWLPVPNCDFMLGSIIIEESP
jgi:hypothetical protein